MSEKETIDMADYKITVDSTCDLPLSYLQENDIHFFRLKFIMDDKEYPDDMLQSMSAKDFYAKLSEGSMSTTSQVNVTDYTEVMEPMLKKGLDILQISFSSGLSGSFNSAAIAVRELSEKYPKRKILLVDSLAASLGYGLLVDYAVEMKMAGKSIDEVYKWLEDNKLNISHQFTVDSLEHLKRGGRVSGAAAAIGTLMKVKPTLIVDAEGHAKAGDKVKGRKKALIALVDKMEEEISAPDGQKIYICHAACIDDAKFVANKVKERFPNIGEIVIWYVGPVIGTHSGPGTVGLFFLGKKRVMKK